MALETADQLFAMLGFGRFWTSTPPLPDGDSISEADELHLLSLSIGPFEEPPAPTLRRVLRGIMGGGVGSRGGVGGGTTIRGR